MDDSARLVANQPEQAGTVSTLKQTSDLKLPSGFALATDGESWQDVARRVLGDEKYAMQLWKENLDAHEGLFDKRPLTSQLIRLPKISDPSRLASKAP